LSAALYTFGIYLYSLLLRLAAPFHRKARLAVEGRKNLLPTIQRALAGNSQPVAWFHAASLGEFEQGRPVMEAFRQRYPDYRIVLTFFSPSGYEVRKNYAGADFIYYLPLDTPENVRAFVDAIQPRIAYFIKYEFWYHYLRELHQRRIPVLSFSTIFRPNQVFFKPYGGFYRSFLRFFNRILVQNEESIRLLEGIGLTNATLAGDTRFDRVRQLAQARKEIPVAEAFRRGPDGPPQPVLVIGSAWQADMDILIPFLNAFEHPLKVIIAPHEIHEAEIERWRSQLKAPSVRYSALTTSSILQSFTASADRPSILVIDNIGMLTSLYAYGTFAYIGGAFGKGLHNTLEAATFGLPLFFGPNYRKFQEAVDLQREGAAFAIRTTGELTETFRRLYEDARSYQTASDTARRYVQTHTGATEQVLKATARALGLPSSEH